PQEGDKSLEVQKAKITKDAKVEQLRKLLERTNAVPSIPGEFWLRSPMTGIVLSSEFRETLINRFVKPNEPLLRIGSIDPKNPRNSDWEIELKIPQKHIGQVMAAFDYLGAQELDVDLLLANEPTASYRGKLAKSKIASQATINQTENNESEPVVMAWARIHGDDIPKELALPVENFNKLTGVEVRARIRCGPHAMGYSLFYGVWEVVYEKIIFF